MRGPGLGTLRRPVELAKHRLVVMEHRACEMPGTAVGVRIVVGERVGERAVHGLPVRECGRLVDRRAHERMAELDPAVDRSQQSGALRTRKRVPLDPERLGCPQHGAYVPDLIGRGEQHQPLCALRKRPHAAEERALER
jgi:hypothetical protein